MKTSWKTIKEAWLAAAPMDFENIDEPREELAAPIEVPSSPWGDVLHADPGAIQAIKSSVKGHGEQLVLPDDCEFGDNDLCYVEA